MTRRLMEIGARVRLVGDHPWAGYSGTFLGREKVGSFGERPKVRLDIGQMVFVMDESQWCRA